MWEKLLTIKLAGEWVSCLCGLPIFLVILALGIGVIGSNREGDEK